MISNHILPLAKTVRDYHHMKHTLTRSDAILILGNTDTRTIQRGIELYKQGLSNNIIISGGLGKITSKIQKETEAEQFSKIAIKEGIPKKDILLENQSTNTGENINMTKKLLESKGLSYNSFIVVTKPYMERRAYATFKNNWPGKTVLVSSINTTLEEYLMNGKDSENRIINLMVGDLQRIRIYPKKGFQIPQEIPNHVREAYKELVKLGYDKYVIQ